MKFEQTQKKLKPIRMTFSNFLRLFSAKTKDRIRIQIRFINSDKDPANYFGSLRIRMSKHWS